MEKLLTRVRDARKFHMTARYLLTPARSHSERAQPDRGRTSRQQRPQNKELLAGHSPSLPGAGHSPLDTARKSPHTLPPRDDGRRTGADLRHD